MKIFTEGSRRVPEIQDNAEGVSPQEASITEQPSLPPVTESDGDTEDDTDAPLLSRVQDLDAFFKMGPGGFSSNPEKYAFVHLQKYLSNIKWVGQISHLTLQ